VSYWKAGKKQLNRWILSNVMEEWSIYRYRPINMDDLIRERHAETVRIKEVRCQNLNI